MKQTATIKMLITALRRPASKNRQWRKGAHLQNTWFNQQSCFCSFSDC